MEAMVSLKSADTSSDPQPRRAPANYLPAPDQFAPSGVGMPQQVGRLSTLIRVQVPNYLNPKTM